MCCYARDTKETFFFLTTLANVSLEFRILYVREKSIINVFVICNKKDINLWRRVKKEWFRVSESHTFLRSLSLFFFFFFVCGQLNFSRVSQNFITVVCF